MEPTPEKNPSQERIAGNLDIQSITNRDGDTALVLPINLPSAMKRAGWREILEHQIHAEHPITFSMDLIGGGVGSITQEEFLRTNYYSPEQIENFLNEKLAQIESSSRVLLGRSIKKI